MEKDEIKRMVKQKYSELALEKSGSCCCKNERVYTVMSDSYHGLDGYNPDADMGLGCGIPTEFAAISPGDTVVDLGSGAGNDCFVARAAVGESGKVIGVDFSLAMIEKAKANALKMGLENIEFVYGDIENIPLGERVADVILSNCVLNLVPDKKGAFSEIYRVLKPGGHFCISDIILTGDLPDKLKQAAEMYAGCVSSAIKKEQYLASIVQAGFSFVEIKREKPIIVPFQILRQYMSEEEAVLHMSDPTVIYSITVSGKREKKI